MHAQETGATSIRERMQMLQLDQVARNAPQLEPPKSLPRLPPRPPGSYSSSTITTTTITTTTIVAAKKPAPPPLPRRKTSRSSLAESVISVASTSSNNSFGSVGSVSSAGSVGSVGSTRSLPPVYTGKESLPIQFSEKRNSTIPPLPTKRINSLPSPRATPPLPTRRATTAPSQESTKDTAAIVPRRLPPLPARSPVGAPTTPQRPGLPASHTDSAVGSGPPPIPRSTRPPPVPVSSRPSRSCAPHTASPLPCLVCYDFSGPDHHASLPQFHRTQVRSLPELATALTAPFPTALEKARVIFTWLHHNVSYDVHSFLANAVPPQSASATLRTGLAVCAGYADLYQLLATHSGLECVVVGGHGKGYGHNDLPGPPPPFKSTHAWNAIKLTPTYWHLVDPCWGAGHITGPPTPGYHPKFNPECFISPPTIFGRKHFPENPSLQHREDGRTITWEEYMAPTPPQPQFYGQFESLFGFSKDSVQPQFKRIVPGSRVRFAVSLPCMHLPPIKPEDEYVLFLNVGSEFDAKNFYMMEPDGTGRGYECTLVLPREPGLKVTLYYPTQFDGREGKGLGREYFLKRVGKCGWGWSPVVEWCAE